MALITLAIGLVLGALCAAVWLRLKAVTATADLALKCASDTAESLRISGKQTDDMSDRINTHDHEIARLYERANLKRD
jgi:hypothetical protein